MALPLGRSSHSVNPSLPINLSLFLLLVIVSFSVKDENTLVLGKYLPDMIARIKDPPKLSQH